mmetsp:Transcript_18909/g.48354  ORF Transcript_18909/g.48354 Transcript_18909/m.48354 type:complete len:229 (+) Transcript_18909:193-879(+)
MLDLCSSVACPSVRGSSPRGAQAARLRGDARASPPARACEAVVSASAPWPRVTVDSSSRASPPPRTPPLTRSLTRRAHTQSLPPPLVAGGRAVRQHGRLAQEEVPAIGEQLLGICSALVGGRDERIQLLPALQREPLHALAGDHHDGVGHRHDALGAAALARLGGKGPDFGAEAGTLGLGHLNDVRAPHGEVGRGGHRLRERRRREDLRLGRHGGGCEDEELRQRLVV